MPRPFPTVRGEPRDAYDAVVIGAGIGGLQKRHHRKELAEELTDAIDAGHSGLVLLVSDPAAVELEKALAKADHIVQKAVDKAAAEEIKAEAEAAQATADDPAKT